MIRTGAILLLFILLLPGVVRAGAEPVELASLVETVSLGMSKEEVVSKLPGLKPSALSIKEGWDGFELPDPAGEIVSCKCAFASAKLVFLAVETRDGTFAKAKELIEKQYGVFPQPSDHAVFELKKGADTVRLLRTGEEGTAAQILIGNLE